MRMREDQTKSWQRPDPDDQCDCGSLNKPNSQQSIEGSQDYDRDAVRRLEQELEEEARGNNRFVGLGYSTMGGSSRLGEGSPKTSWGFIAGGVDHHLASMCPECGRSDGRHKMSCDTGERR